MSEKYRVTVERLPADGCVVVFTAWLLTFGSLGAAIYVFA